MTHILLLGAGFSRNWGGQLADEFFDSLIGLPEIRDDAYLKQLLWKSKSSGGFENALAVIQKNYMSDPVAFAERLRQMQCAISNTFHSMNEAFFEILNWEFQQHKEKMLRTFLFKFDAIFTLNQDILLEHHYCRHVDLCDGENWSGAQLPGMRRILSQECNHDPSWGKDLWAPLDPGQFHIEPRHQPLLKLHGSSNWRDTEGGQLLVIGGQKSRGISSHAVLAWYFEKFKEYLAGPNAKLFVIGYGFKDLHVNKLIIESVKNRKLRFFVIDHFGSDVVKHANPSFGGTIYAPNALDEAFEQGLIGASKRSLSETFKNDFVEHAKVMRFFE